MKITVLVNNKLEREIAARGETLSEGLRSSLERYYLLLEDARNKMRELFSPEELNAICRAGSGTLFEPHTLRGLLWNLEDMTAEEAGLDVEAKEKLLEKLRNLSLVEHAALVDAVERFWRSTMTGMPVEPARILDS